MKTIPLSSTRTGGSDSGPDLQRLLREHLVYEVDGLLYATALADFDGVAEAGFNLEPLPGFPIWRGEIEDNQGTVPVLSLHQILDAAYDKTDGINPGEHRLLMFRWEGVRLALHVHHCLGVFPIESTTRLSLTRSPLLRDADSGLRAVIKWNSRLLVTLDPAELISDATGVQIRSQLAAIETKKKAARRGKRGAEAELAAAAANTLQLEGALNSNTLAQVMQVLWMKRLTGQLSLETGAGDTSATVLFWENGQLIHARSTSNQTAESVISTAMKSSAGSFHFRSGPLAGISRTVQETTQHLIQQTIQNSK